MSRIDTPPAIGRVGAGGPRDAAVPPVGRGERPIGVLIVDDDPGVRGVLAAGLWHHGFAVWVAAGGAEAVTAYRASRAFIDVALLDVQMPGCDGPGALAALREYDPDVRACFMTGFSARYSDHDLLALGAVAVFQKPFVIQELAHRLGALPPRPDPAPPTAGVPVGPGRRTYR